MDPIWVVCDGQGRVVVMFSGADAEASAAEWAERGYAVVELEQAAVDAA